MIDPRKRAKLWVKSLVPAGLRSRLRMARYYNSVPFLFLPRKQVERKAVEKLYRSVFDRLPRLDNPLTFTEKVQWRKLYDRRQLWAVLCDKLGQRAYIRDTVGEEYLVPLLWNGEQPERLPFDSLSTPYVIKPSHWSGVVFIVRDADRKSRSDRQTIVEYLNWCLRHQYGVISVEWGYRHANPGILVEKLLVDQAGSIPSDYKVHCFDGEPYLIHVDVDRFGDHSRSLYDSNWQKLNVEMVYPEGPDIPRPGRLDEMLEVASQLSKDLDYVRVDLYNSEEGVKCGEVTPYHGSGLSRFAPPSYDRRLGERWSLPDRVSEKEKLDRGVNASELSTSINC